MIRKPLAEALIDSLTRHMGADYSAASFQPHGAGCINDTYKVVGNVKEPVFLKVGTFDALAMYQTEAKGLALLAQCEAIRIPQMLFCEQMENHSVLALEYIELQPVGLTQAQRFGQGLAQLHSITAQQFGLDHNNFIGRTPQINQRCDSWWDFFSQMRLTPQKKLAQLKGLRSQVLAQLDLLIECVGDAMQQRMEGQTIHASLLHGDLWNGNVAVDETGKPVIYDPAVYFGDAETDIAMSKMFGALPQGVYEAYHEVHPPGQCIALRHQLYDLYHWLNHFNLFGVTYLGQVENTLQSVLSQLEQ